MSRVNLPIAAVRMLASSAMRTHHLRWHHVRSRWHAMSLQERASFRAVGFEPPRLDPIARPGDVVAAPPRDPGAGLDFLYMHRRMIEQLNDLLVTIGDPGYPRVEGWPQIPWDHDDPHWPMPPAYNAGVARSKDQAVTDFYRDLVATRLQNDTWMQTVSLDELGATIERGIHNWMHMHWSDVPWFTGAPGQNEDDPRNDYLGSTYSSHVNTVFWKLHGWIDDRIGQWEAANGTQADFSDSWDGPVHHHEHKLIPVPESMHPHDDQPLISTMPRTQAEKEFSTEVFLRGIE